MSTARSITLYIEPRTLKRLRLALKLYPAWISEAGATRATTADELANQLLNETILRRFPLVKDLESVLTQAERDFLTEHKTKEQQHENTDNSTTT